MNTLDKRLPLVVAIASIGLVPSACRGESQSEPAPQPGNQSNTEFVSIPSVYPDEVSQNLPLGSLVAKGAVLVTWDERRRSRITLSIESATSRLAANQQLRRTRERLSEVGRPIPNEPPLSLDPDAVERLIFAEIACLTRALQAYQVVSPMTGTYYAVPEDAPCRRWLKGSGRILGVIVREGAKLSPEEIEHLGIDHSKSQASSG
ncbi:MAG: hypothetical protein AAGJ46_09040 [Planctomycetota bacterium]